ncbi:ribonuclease III [Campylobacter sp. MOP7]|uniref:ribonuclease III n=1 Tax=Campylobacter canis TaxID=3378588 RepID=UPI00387E344A
MQNLKTLEEKLGYKFKEINNLKNALTHKSCKKGKNNERLEFLGDAVMDLVIADYLFRKFKNTDEGDMSKLRAALVNEKSFANLASYLNLGEHIFISAAEENNGGREKISILSDAFEAVMGAIYIESGFEEVNSVAIRLFEICYPDIDLKNLTKDYKTTLQEITQAKLGVTPEYKLVRSFGPDHKKEFEIALLLKDVEISRAIGKSKKEAQQLAAKTAIEKIKDKS